MTFLNSEFWKVLPHLRIVCQLTKKGKKRKRRIIPENEKRVRASKSTLW